MRVEIEIRISPENVLDQRYILTAAAKKCNISLTRIKHIQLLKKSIDARKRKPLFQLRLALFIDEEFVAESILPKFLKVTNSSNTVIIIGAGPAGYFAALQCLELGLKPIVVDRGKDVRARRKDLKAIQQDGLVNPDSNYCFGEGGAGTYSDGKLYTRSHKRGNIQEVLELLVQHGAKTDILSDAHPHIGSNKLPGIISNIRETILEHGGRIHFETRIVDFEIKDQKLEAIIAENGERFVGDAYVLATGHSARDIYELFFAKNLTIESKPFAMGVRLEHPQALIDEIQYNQSPRHKNLPAASYKLVTQVEEKGVFSFCMCPGGLIVPAATAPGEIVVNGMSLSKRNSAYANSGVVTEVAASDLKRLGHEGIAAGIDFQRSVEQSMFALSDGTQKAPAQRLTDFVNGRSSSSLSDSSYIPGLMPSDLHQSLPEFIYKSLKAGVKAFDKKMKGYYTAEANVVAIESRTSSPVRIPRHSASLTHPDLINLYPCGEGCGFAGGILSAALDGRNVAKAISKSLNGTEI